MIRMKMIIKTTELDLEELMLMPSVTNRKNIDNSKGLLTGCLNLTIDKAPTIPSDKAMLLDILLVMTKEMRGNKKQVSIKL